MSEDHLMNGLLIIVFSGIVVFVCFQFLKKYFPESAFTSFRSFSEIKKYFHASVSIIKKTPWLLFFPLFLTLSNYLFKIPFFLFQRPDISSLPDDFVYKLYGISVMDIIRSLLKTPNVLDYGFHGAITGSILFLGFFFISCITFKAESKKLQRYLTEENRENVAYFEKMLKYSLIVLAIIVFLAAGLILTGAQANSLFFYIFYNPAMMLVGIMSLSMFSLIEGCLLFAVKGAVSGENQNFNTLLNKSLSILKPLFLLNIIVAVIGYLPSVVRFPMTVSSFMDAGSGQFFMTPVLLNLAIFLAYGNSLLMIFIFCAPFFLVMHPVNVKDAIRLLFKFIQNNLIKYLIFTGTGILLLFLPTLFHMTINLLTQIHPLKLEYTLIEMVFTAMRIVLAVVFYIAMFGFVIDTK